MGSPERQTLGDPMYNNVHVTVHPRGATPTPVATPLHPQSASTFGACLSAKSTNRSSRPHQDKDASLGCCTIQMDLALLPPIESRPRGWVMTWTSWGIRTLILDPMTPGLKWTHSMRLIWVFSNENIIPRLGWCLW
jgi:hypothetical protein